MFAANLVHSGRVVLPGPETFILLRETLVAPMRDVSMQSIEPSITFVACVMQVLGLPQLH